MEITDFSPPAQRPSSNSKVVLSPSQPIGYEPDNSTERLTSIATAQEMLNIWPASKLAGKGGSVNTADGKIFFYLLIVLLVSFFEILGNSFHFDEIWEIFI